MSITRTLVLILSSSLVACSSDSLPDETDGRQVIQHRIAQQSEGRIELLEFGVTNGQSRTTLDGIDAYTMEYEARIRFLEDSYWRRGSQLEQMISNEISFRTQPIQPSSGPFDWNDWTLRNQGFDRVTRGDEEVLKGRLNFEQTERGWRTMEGELLSDLALQSSPDETDARVSGEIDRLPTPQPQVEESPIDLPADALAASQAFSAILEAVNQGLDTLMLRQHFDRNVAWAGDLADFRSTLTRDGTLDSVEVLGMRFFRGPEVGKPDVGPLVHVAAEIHFTSSDPMSVWFGLIKQDGLWRWADQGLFNDAPWLISGQGILSPPFN